MCAGTARTSSPAPRCSTWDGDDRHADCPLRDRSRQRDRPRRRHRRIGARAHTWRPRGASRRRPPRRHGVHVPQPAALHRPAARRARRPIDRGRGAIVRSGPRPRRPEGFVASVARYSWADHYAELRLGLEAVADSLRSDGERAVVFADDNAIVDREVAARAGLGWYGKNANLLLHGAGSFFVLGCVITTACVDAPAVTEAPFAAGCGSCRRCIDACPTGAIVADGVIDANRCLAWLLQRGGDLPVEYRVAVGDRIYGCDDCQTACPPTVRLGRRHERAVPDAAAWVGALELLASTDAELLERHGRWYIADRDPRWLRRNALVVLGNTASRDDQAVLATLRHYAASTDAVLADCARWSLDQLE
ncbi:MAG: 4Fe-4S double cluster binding domain-containing protein [Ilumatobacteraceae bacterium]